MLAQIVHNFPNWKENSVKFWMNGIFFNSILVELSMKCLHGQKQNRKRLKTNERFWWVEWEVFKVFFPSPHFIIFGSVSLRLKAALNTIAAWKF